MDAASAAVGVKLRFIYYCHRSTSVYELSMPGPSSLAPGSPEVNLFPRPQSVSVAGFAAVEVTLGVPASKAVGADQPVGRVVSSSRPARSTPNKCLGNSQ